MREHLWGALVVLGLGAGMAACAAGSDDSASGGGSGGGAPTPPQQPPPTGGRWKGVEVTNDCGRTTVEWIVVDETCGDIGAENYLEPFEAPMFRDGTVVGDLMYAVDASTLWVLDVSDPTALQRQALLTGFGRPLAVGQHAGDVVVAAADAGVLVLDVTEPLSPVVTARVPVEGLALDVHVRGDLAYVASGAGGVQIVDLAAQAPSVVQSIPINGFAAGVVANDTHAVVAACDTVAVVDLATGGVVGETWIQGAYDGDLLVAPAKDVELVGDVAFVAAGRYGAVAVDVSTPEAPKVLGNCTLTDELMFYASGVRAEGSALFVAGGEWGIMKVDVPEPPVACNTMMLPTTEGPPQASGSCTADPPWEVVDWQDRWAPPPPPPPPRPTTIPENDPIQTLPHGGVLFAFGDARRIGLRTVFAHDPASDILAGFGRYDEPRLVDDIAARAGRVLVAGRAGAVFDVGAGGVLTPLSVPEAKNSQAGELLDDGRWAFVTEQGQLAIEAATPVDLSLTVWPRGLVADGNRLNVATDTELVTFDDAGGVVARTSFPETAHLPASLAMVDGSAVVAAPEWTGSIGIREGSLSALPEHGLFDENEILDASLWQIGLPRRVLLAAGTDLVEVATLGNEAGLYDHQTGKRTALPAGTYVGGAFAGDRVHLAVADRDRYRSQIVTVMLDPNGPVVEGIESFTGVAADLASDGSYLYVGDADGAVRVYEVGSDGRPLPLVVQRLQVQP